MVEQYNLPVILVRQPWNKGKLIGAKPPLRSKHVWSIRTKLQIEERKRDLALFNLAIDSKLRGCDVVSIRVEEIAPRGYAVDRATVRQKKTGHPVRFEITEQTRQALDDYISAEGKRAGEFLFNGRKKTNRCLTTRQYARLVSKWIASCGLDPSLLWNAFTEANQGDNDLQAHRKSACSSVVAGTHQDREYRQISRHRG